MPKVVEPQIPNYPPQGIQAQLDLLYLWNPDAANELIKQLEELIKDVQSNLDYNKLVNKPTLDTTSTNALVAGTEEVVGAVKLHKVSKTGSYEDLNDQPNLDLYATKTALAAGLGSKADLSTVNTIRTDLDDLGDQVHEIEAKVPAAATADNQLADKAFVNSSINAVAAYYITSTTEGDSFATKADLDKGPYYFQGAARVPTTNDYALVKADETHEGSAARYMYDGKQWDYQYTLNDTPFTQAQVDAINSGITAGLVSKYNAAADTVDMLDSEVGTLKTEMSAAQTDIGALKTASNTQAGLISDLQNDKADKTALPQNQTGTAGQVYTKTTEGAEWQDASGGGTNAGIKGDYFATWGWTEGDNGLPAIVSGSNNIKTPASIVMMCPGADGYITFTGEMTYENELTEDFTLFYARNTDGTGATLVGATDVVWSDTEPEPNGQSGFQAWKKSGSSTWQLRSNDTGNTWREVVGGPIADVHYTDGTVTRLDFDGYRQFNKQQYVKFASGSGATLQSWIPVMKPTTPNKTNFSIGGERLIIDTAVGQLWGSTEKSIVSMGAVATAFKTPLSHTSSNTNLGCSMADLEKAVPTPPTTAGNYVLKATVAEDGTVTTQWIAETTQGIPDYTAGVSIPDATHSGTEYTTWYTATADGVIMGSLKRDAAGTSYLAVGEQELQEFGSSSGGDVFPVSITVNNGDVLSWKNNVGTGTTHNCVFFPFKS